MNYFERSLLRMEELQRRINPIPQWAKAEKMEGSVSLKEIWETEKEKPGIWERVYELLKKQKS